jgi:hypothetical protein
MMLALTSFFFILLRTLPAPETPKPSVTPFFMSSLRVAGPAFFVACENTTGRSISSGSDVWVLSKRAIRLDGSTLSDTEGRIGPGLAQNVEPGATWRGIIELRQAVNPSWAVAFGALVRAPLTVPLETGRHTIAVRCAGVWSDDTPFYWEK